MVLSGFKAHKFEKLTAAKKKQKALKAKFGFTPSIFEEKNTKTKKKKFVVIQAKGLKKV